MIKVVAQSAKLLGFVLLFAFVSQTFFEQAEHVGAIACLSDSGKSVPDTQDQNSPHCDECCSQVLAVSPTDSPSWSSFISKSFINRDDTLPEGPSATIDQPPRLA